MPQSGQAGPPAAAVRHPRQADPHRPARPGVVRDRPPGPRYPSRSLCQAPVRRRPALRSPPVALEPGSGI